MLVTQKLLFAIYVFCIEEADWSVPIPFVAYSVDHNSQGHLRVWHRLHCVDEDDFIRKVVACDIRLDIAMSQLLKFCNLLAFYK